MSDLAQLTKLNPKAPITIRPFHYEVSQTTSNEDDVTINAQSGIIHMFGNVTAQVAFHMFNNLVDLDSVVIATVNDYDTGNGYILSHQTTSGTIYFTIQKVSGTTSSTPNINFFFV